MVSDATRNAVWQGYLDVVRLTYYYEVLSDRYQRIYLTVRFAMLFFVIVSVASSFMSLPQPVTAIILVGITAILVALDYVGDFARKAALLHGISSQVRRLGFEWEALWLGIDEADTEDKATRQKNVELQRLVTDVAERAGEAGITINNKLNQKCMEKAYAIVEDRHRYDQGEVATSYAS